jgi:hypothetical protein
MPKTKAAHGGARYSTRPDAKPRGTPPDWRKQAERMARQIRHFAPVSHDREMIRSIILEALDELEKPIII